MIIIFAILGFAIGIGLGICLPLDIPTTYAHYTSVALLSCLDTVVGGGKAAFERLFDSKHFIVSFFANSLLAVMLVYVGDLLGINLYYVALIGFGLRIFLNVAAIRRILLSKRL